MRYINVPCEACGRPFAEQDDVVVCPNCGAPYHRACWDAAGACRHKDEHASGYVWASPLPQNDGIPAAAVPEKNREETLSNGETIIRCPRCGARNYQHDAFCLHCGAGLSQRETGAQEGPRVYERRDDEDTFDGPPRITDEMLHNFQRYGGLDPDAEIDGIPVCEYSDYVGGANPGRMIRKISLAERFGKSSTFLGAALLGPVWLLYRKLRREGWVIGMAMILLCLASGILQINRPFVQLVKKLAALPAAAQESNMSPEDLCDRMTAMFEEYTETDLTKAEKLRAGIGEGLQYLSFMGTSLFSAARGMYFYRRKAKQDIMQIRAESASMEEYRYNLMREGGGSAGGAVAGLIIAGVAFVCMTYVPLFIVLLYF